MPPGESACWSHSGRRLTSNRSDLDLLSVHYYSGYLIPIRLCCAGSRYRKYNFASLDPAARLACGMSNLKPVAGNLWLDFDSAAVRVVGYA